MVSIYSLKFSFSSHRNTRNTNSSLCKLKDYLWYSGKQCDAMSFDKEEKEGNEKKLGGKVNQSDNQQDDRQQG